MAKTREKNKARELRQQGESIKVIAKRLRVSKSSVSQWCRDIELNQRQIKKLQERMLKGSYKGLLKGARIQLERRLEHISQLNEAGRKLIGSLSNRDLLLIGIGLYWGEGAKQRRAQIVNSNPEIIKFTIKWFEEIWKIPKERFTCQVLINKIHQNRVSKVERYWSKITGVPRNQFIKTTLIKAKNKKVYKNLENHFGTLMITIREGTDLRYSIEGLILAIAKQAT